MPAPFFKTGSVSVAIAILTFSVFVSACGLKTAPIPPERDAEGNIIRHESEWFPKAPKEPPDEREILEMYGRKPQPSKVEENLGDPSVLKPPDDPALDYDWPEWSLPAETPPPAADEVKAPADGKENEDAASDETKDGGAP